MEEIVIRPEQVQSVKIESVGRRKSLPCTLVLRLMDTEEYSCDYCKSLSLVLALFPETDQAELEKELDRYI